MLAHGIHLLSPALISRDVPRPCARSEQRDTLAHGGVARRGRFGDEVRPIAWTVGVSTVRRSARIARMSSEGHCGGLKAGTPGPGRGPASEGGWGGGVWEGQNL